MNKKAYYGEFGGQFVSESLMNTLQEVDDAFEAAMKDPEFLKPASGICDKPCLFHVCTVCR